MNKSKHDCVRCAYNSKECGEVIVERYNGSASYIKRPDARCKGWEEISHGSSTTVKNGNQ